MNIMMKRAATRVRAIPSGSSRPAFDRKAPAMAEKISEALWKAFTKKQKLEVELEDKDLLKALARFDKTDERKPEPRLEALEDLVKEIPKQVTALVKLKKKLGDKPFGAVKDELYAILEEAEALQKKTQAVLAAAGAEDDDDEDEPGNVLLEPKRLLAMLTRCKRDPALSMRFAFVDAKDKQAAVFAMHPKMSGKKLFAALQAETGVKTGAFGSAWVQVNGEFPGTCLMLQLDKPLSGLVKKVRGPVKAVGFKIAKAVLWNADGTVFEQESESEEPAASDTAAEGPTATTAATPDHKALSDAFKDRLKRVLALARQAGDPDAAAQAKKLCADAGMHSSNRDWAKVDALMTQAEDVLRGSPPETTAPAATAQPASGGGAGTTRSAPDHKALSDAFKDRLKAVLALAREAGDTAASAQAKKLCADAGMHSSNRDWAKVDALMTQAEDLLRGKPATSPGSTAAPTAATSAPANAGAEPNVQAPMATGTAKAPPGAAALPFKSRLAGMVPRMKPVEAAGGPVAREMAAKRDAAVALVREKGFNAEQLPRAMALLDEIEALIAGTATSSPADDVHAGTAPAARWAAERAKVAARLQAEIKDIVATKNPLAGNAELELRAVLRQINGELATKRQATEMQRYLSDDDVVADVSELAVDIKTPLLKVLDQIASSLPG